MVKGISVVVAAHYRPELLKKTLEAVLKQDYPNFEVLVVGYNRDKSLAGVEKQFFGKNVQFHRINSTFVDKKRNQGIRKAKHEIVAFTDDDCLPEKNWLKSIADSFEKNPGIAGVEGFTWNDNKGLYSHAPDNFTGNRFLACNYAFKKSVLNEIKGFDESYHLNYREDTDLAFKMLEKGYKIAFSKKARVYHPAIRQALRTPLKELKGVRSDVLLFKKFPKRFREHFGFVCRGLFKLSGFAWLTLAAAVFGIYSGVYTLSLVALLAVVYLKVFVEKKGRKGSLPEWVAFVFFSYLRDLLFPLVFAYQWAKLRVERAEGDWDENRFGA